MILIPVIDGQPLKGPEEFQQLAEEQQKAIEQNRRELLSDLSEFPRQQRDIMRAMAEDIRLVEQRFCEDLIAPHIRGIAQEMDTPAIDSYLEQVKTHVVEHLDHFKEAEAQAPMPPGMPFSLGQERDQFYEYDVNVVVDNAHTSGARPSLWKVPRPTRICLVQSNEWLTEAGGWSPTLPGLKPALCCGRTAAI